jgi:hypothetical protein
MFFINEFGGVLMLSHELIFRLMPKWWHKFMAAIVVATIAIVLAFAANANANPLKNYDQTSTVKQTKPVINVVISYSYNSVTADASRRVSAFNGTSMVPVHSNKDGFLFPSKQGFQLKLVKNEKVLSAFADYGDAKTDFLEMPWSGITSLPYEYWVTPSRIDVAFHGLILSDIAVDIYDPNLTIPTATVK